MLIQRGYAYLSQHGMMQTLRRCFWLLRRKLLIRGYPLIRLLPIKVIQSTYGVRLTANFDDATFRLCLCGMYGSAFSNFLREKSMPYIFLDIGANQGLFSLVAAQNPQCEHIYAFEPMDTTFALLKDNILLNDCKERIQAYPYAIDENQGMLTMHAPVYHSGAASLHMHQRKTGTTHHTVQCINHEMLDKLILQTSTPLVVKIDTEGHEMSIINTLMRTLLWPRITHLLIEIDEQWIDAPALLQQLKEEGFNELFRISSEDHHYDVMFERKVSRASL